MWILRFAAPFIALTGHAAIIAACCDAFASFAPPDAYGAWLLLVSVGVWIGFSGPILPAWAWLKWRERRRWSAFSLGLMCVFALLAVSLSVSFVRTADTALWPCAARADLYGLTLVFAGPLVCGVVSLFYMEALARPQNHTHDIPLEKAPQSVAVDAPPLPHLRPFDERVLSVLLRVRNTCGNSFSITNRDVASHLGCSTSTVNASLHRLDACGAFCVAASRDSTRITFGPSERSNVEQAQA